MRSVGRSLAYLAFCIATPNPASATDVQVQVLNVADPVGTVRVAVCTADQWLKPSCVLGGTAPARPGLVSITVTGIPPGVYSVLAHHDGNDDGIVNRDLLGRPTEGIGFSRDAPIRFGPPRFEDARLAISGDRVTIPIRLLFEQESARTSSR